MGVRHGRVVLAVVATAAMGSLAAGCSADGPTTALERGERIYQANCAQCHAADLAGNDRGPSLLSPIYGPEQLSDADFADAVRNGVPEQRWEFGPMPGNGALSDEQIDAMSMFVRARQAGDRPD